MTFYKDFVHRATKFIRDSGIKTPIFLGGPYPTGDYKNVLKDKNIDLCMLGESETTLAELVGYMIKNNKQLPSYDRLKEISGVSFVQKLS
jgi:radical SAM superfamily enzyme YgiQ (UPF0313 family)